MSSRPSQWWLAGGRRIRLALQPRRRVFKPVHLSLAGSGIALWAGYSVAETLREVAREMAPTDPRQLLYLIDEPERHLHPSAQIEAAAYVAKLAQTSNVVVATHSAAFINTESPLAALVRVHRDDDRTTRAEEITGDVLGRLRDDLEAAGLTVADLVQLTRGVLLVEGRHDKLIVEQLCGKQLRRARIVVMLLRGSHEALALRRGGVPADWDMTAGEGGLPYWARRGSCFKTCRHAGSGTVGSCWAGFEARDRAGQVAYGALPPQLSAELPIAWRTPSIRSARRPSAL